MFWTEDRRRFSALIERLSLRPVDAAAEAEMGAPLQPRLGFSLECVMAGEEHIGLDALCANLSDYQVPLTDEDRAVIIELAGRWGLDDLDVGRLDELVNHSASGDQANT